MCFEYLKRNNVQELRGWKVSWGRWQHPGGKEHCGQRQEPMTAVSIREDRKSKAVRRIHADLEEWMEDGGD